MPICGCYFYCPQRSEGFCHPERSAAKSKDPARAKMKEQRYTDYQILRYAQNDKESKEKTEREQGEIRERSARKKYDVNNNAPNAYCPPHDAGILLYTRIVVGSGLNHRLRHCEGFARGNLKRSPRRFAPRDDGLYYGLHPRLAGIKNGTRKAR